MRIGRKSGQSFLQGGGSSAGERKRGREGRGRGGRSRGRSLLVANTEITHQSHPHCERNRVDYLILHKHSPETVEELEWRDDMALNQD